MKICLVTKLYFWLNIAQTCHHFEYWFNIVINNHGKSESSGHSLTIITMKTCQEQWKFQLQSSIGWLRSVPSLFGCQSIESPGVFKITRKFTPSWFWLSLLWEAWPYQNGFRRGREGGSFSIQKIILQIFAILNGTLVMNSRKNLQYNFPKMREGSKAVWNFSENLSVLEM